MGALGYLYRTTFKNRIKMALKKPVTYVYAVFVLIYLLVIPFSINVLLEEFGGGTPGGMAIVLTLFGFWILPTNLIAYSKRKGLTYRNCDVHFLFPSPVGPKQILLFAHLKTLFTSFILNVIVAVLGAMFFQVDIWRVLVYLFFSLILENILEGCIMMIVYGSEKLTDEMRKGIKIFAYGLLIAFVVIGLVYYLRDGFTLEMAVNFLHSDAVQLVPITGWYIAVVHLIFVGPTTVNLISAVCFMVLTVTLLVIAVRMKCTGQYYEDAIKFAEDYEEALKKTKETGNSTRVGKKQKFGTAKVTWKGTGAKALFYRQLLEYKKNRFFIFDASTLISIIGGVAVAYIYHAEGGFGEDESFMRELILPGLSAYIIFIFSSLSGKWGKELKSPYTYLIPDAPFKKLMYATAMQHVQSLINALLLLTPGTIIMGLSPVNYLFSVLFYVLLSANKLYALTVTELIAGNTFGVTGKQLLQMLIQGIAIGMGFMGAALGYALGDWTMAYIMMDVFLLLYTGIFMVISALNFERLETA